MRVMWCESRGDPDAVNAESGASGLMQHIPRYWDERARAAGFQGASPFDPMRTFTLLFGFLTREGGITGSVSRSNGYQKVRG